jgi:hypothetical protein
LYLRWLAKHEQQPAEDAPLGIILCAGKKQEQIELLELNQSGIHVAEYLTALPSSASATKTPRRHRECKSSLRSVERAMNTRAKQLISIIAVLFVIFAVAIALWLNVRSCYC